MALLLVDPFSAHARETDAQLWTQLTFNPRYPSGLRLFKEAPPRLGQNYSDFTDFIFRPAVGYQVNPAVSLWLEASKRRASVASNELFWNLNSTPSGPQAGFDQIRPYLGVSYRLSRQARVEMGYLAAFVNSPRDRPDRTLSVVPLSMKYSL